ncbi:MAG: PDZ domain-containing protein [candidate division Zixibacteria bacterium]
MNSKVIDNQIHPAFHLLWRGLLAILMLWIVLTLLSNQSFAVDEERTNETQTEETLPGSYRIVASDGVVRFPFDIFGGDIRFDAEINGHPVKMLLDDGFHWDPLLFWGSPEVDALGFTYDGEIAIGGSSDESNLIPSRTASGITLTLPGVEFYDQTAVITAYTSGNASMWTGSVGQVSCTFLKHFVVDINFDEMMITLIEPAKFKYSGKGSEIHWKPLGFGPWSIPATIALGDGRTVSLELLMDLGYNDQLQIASGGKHNISPPKQSIAGSLGFDIQRNETLGFFGRVSEVNIGGYSVDGVICSFAAEEHTESAFHEAMIGLGLLSRFNLVFDRTRERMFVEPNQSYKKPYEFNMSGFSLRRGRGDYLSVARVHPNSPASEAGLIVGDIITQINGRPASDYSRSERSSLFQQAGGTVTIVTTRDNQELKLSLTLRRLI